MFRILLATYVTLMLTCGVVQAQTIMNTYTKCIIALEDGQMDEVKSLAAIIKTKKNLTPDSIEKGEACLEAAYGTNWAYDQLFKMWVEGDEAIKAENRAAKENAQKVLFDKRNCLKRKEEAIIRLQEAQTAFIAARNEELINDDLLTACYELYAENPYTAILDSDCRAIFRTKMHPGLNLSESGKVFFRLGQELRKTKADQIGVEEKIEEFENKSSSKTKSKPKPNDLEIAFQSCD